MPDRLMGIDYLIQTEENVRDQTIQEWGEELEKLTQTIELIFRLSHFLVEDVEIDSEDHAFHNIAYSAFIRLPYTLKSIRNLWFS